MKKSFELKKVVSIIALSAFLGSGSAFASQTSEDIFQGGVDSYRKGDVQECYDTMRALKKKDPTNAYIIYYLAMASTKLGELDEAKKNYEEVILLNSDSSLVSYAKEGLQNIESASGVKADKIESSTKKASRDIDRPSASKSEGVEKKASVSDEEVAKAIKTLREAGLLNVNLGVASNPMAGMDPTMMQQNSELMNLNMMMGTMNGSGKSSGMDMLPFLMMQQGANGSNSKISPEVIQMMMNNSMLDSMSAFDTNNKDK